MTEDIKFNNKLNYEEFLKVKQMILNNNRDIIDLSDNNLYKFFPFSALSEAVKICDEQDFEYHMNGNVHRCHLVEDWLNYFNIDLKYKKNIGFSKGVRQTIELISGLDNYRFKRWLIPSDVYPFYNNTLSKNFTPTAFYPTLTAGNVPFFLTENGSQHELFLDADVVLITMPSNPLGAGASGKGLLNLFALIEKFPEKTFIIDGVYFYPHQENITDSISNLNQDNMSYWLSLFDLGNVYFLTSLSKTWSMPNIMGITFIPERDNHIKEHFKNLSIDNQSLKLAYLALNKYKYIPEFISKYFSYLRNELDIFWKHNFHYSFFKNLDLGYKHLDNLVVRDSYLFYIDIEPENLLAEKILVIPASVFGGKKGSVISILNKNLNNINKEISLK